MTERVGPPPPASSPEAGPPSVAERLAFYQRAGGIVAPLMTALLAFVIGGLVIFVTTGNNPLSTYRAIFDGTGLNWFLHVGSHQIGVPFSNSKVWFPWDTGSVAALNLQQTLLIVTPLILTGIAVAFAFRCGLFNIGGSGQYTAGALVGVQFGVWFAGMPKPLHILLVMVAATLAGAFWAGIAGFLKATVGAHEVITTIMLNWIALWVGSYLVGFNGPMQDPRAISAPVTRPIAESAKLPVFWGNPALQGLHIGFFIAIGALIVYWIILKRTTLGYEVRAVGFNPEAARYGGISVRKSYFLAMAISGAFAGLAGAIDILGWEFNLDLTVVQTVQIGFIGIAVALLGRNTPIGIFLAALLFGALLTGTSTRNLDPSIFKPELAGNLTRIIQGLVVLFVGADLLIVYFWATIRKPFLKLRRRPAVEPEPQS
ncbi:MAG: ABC transporter permease [Gaiellaceae bacterium]